VRGAAGATLGHRASRPHATARSQPSVERSPPHTREGSAWLVSEAPGNPSTNHCPTCRNSLTAQLPMRPATTPKLGLVLRPPLARVPMRPAQRNPLQRTQATCFTPVALPAPTCHNARATGSNPRPVSGWPTGDWPAPCWSLPLDDPHPNPFSRVLRAWSTLQHYG